VRVRVRVYVRVLCVCVRARACVCVCSGDAGGADGLARAGHGAGPVGDYAHGGADGQRGEPGQACADTEGVREREREREREGGVSE
jgi:hypothetical protein